MQKNQSLQKKMAIIRSIFFDLGRTLLYPKASWQPVFMRANKALANSLATEGIEIDERTFPYEFADNLNKYYAARETTHRETTIIRILGSFLAEKGIWNVSNSTLRIALDAFYAITQKNWLLEEDAHTTLRTLKSRGYKLALLSNASDDADVQTLIDKNDLRHYFSFIRTSAATGYRKPHPHLFKEALSALNLLPEQCVMVGDTLNADIAGANKLGIYSIWINRRVNKTTKTLISIHPKATIQELSELPNLLQEIP